MPSLVTERLYEFPSKSTLVPADLVYAADSNAAFDEVNTTVAGLIGAYPSLLAIGSTTFTNNTFPYFNNTGTVVAGAISSLAVSLLSDTTQSAMQATIGAAPGSPALTSIANLTTTANEMIYTTASNTYATNPVSAATLAMMAQTSNASIMSTIGALPLAGGTLTGAILNYTTTPTNSLELVPKSYVDMIAVGITVQPSCYAGTTANLNATYLNGVSGVGATLTNAGSLAAFTVDGVTPSANARILVKNQSTTYQNGIYTLTTVGSGSVAWVLTRATDYNAAADINPGDLVIVDNGTTLMGSSWLQTATVTTIGTSAITFSQFTAALPIGLGFGGTGTALTASNGGIVYSNATTLAILSGVATAGLALLSGASGAPTWSTLPPITKINPIFITSSTTYTPSSGIVGAFVGNLGGGAQGGGVTGSGANATGSAGGAGNFVLSYLTKTQLGSSAITVTIGAQGAGAGADSNGNNGGNTSFAASAGTITANGGQGGLAVTASGGAAVPSLGGAGGAAATALAGTTLLNLPGQSGGLGISFLGGGYVPGSIGASGMFGAGGAGTVANGGAVNGINATGYGSGGSGATLNGSGSASGGSGTGGLTFIIELISI